MPTDDAGYDAQAGVMMRELAAVFRDSSDCPALASGLRRYTSEHQAQLRAMKDYEKRETPEQKKAFEDRHKDEIADMMKAMEPVVKKCAMDKDVQASMKDFD